MAQFVCPYDALFWPNVALQTPNSTLNAQRSMLNAQYSTLNTQHSKLYNSTLIFAYKCWGISMDGACQQFNTRFHTHIWTHSPTTHQMFLVCTHHVNESTLIFTHTCWSISLEGACQQINSSPDRHLCRIFFSLPTTSTIQRSFSHTHMEASTHHPPRQQINA